MSKERELLERIVKADMVEYMRLMDEAEELLAQPEQEPVEDRIARWHKLGYEQGRKSALTKQEPLTPRQGLEEYKRGYAQAELDLKREPIEDGELEVWYSQHAWAMDKQEYMWGFRDAEKCYGIGGGE